MVGNIYAVRFDPFKTFDWGKMKKVKNLNNGYYDHLKAIYYTNNGLPAPIILIPTRYSQIEIVKL